MTGMEKLSSLWMVPPREGDLEWYNKAGAEDWRDGSWLRALAALPEGSGSIPNSRMMAHCM